MEPLAARLLAVVFRPVSRLALGLVLCLPALPVRAEPAAELPPPAADISPVRETLKVLHDGKNHYIAIVPFGDVWTHFYYGDGKAFHAQRVTGGGSSGKESFDRVFWEPRAEARWKASFGFRDGQFTLQCDDRRTTFTAVDAEAARKVLESARFFEHLWARRAYALARDTAGTYYYVDTGNRPNTQKSFRLYAGPRGRLKLLPMVNVVSDSAGDIFATKTGKLRLVLDRAEGLWIDGKREVKLTVLPVEDNARMIYADLGVYLGQRLGTPCDDL